MLCAVKGTFPTHRRHFLLRQATKKWRSVVAACYAETYRISNTQTRRGVGKEAFAALVMAC
eukprot:6173234-Pleurochrysis_carterae.AAC.3